MNTLLISSAEALSLAFTPAEFQREELIPAGRSRRPNCVT